MGNDITERFIINMYVRGMKISEIANTVNITPQEVTEIIEKSKREISKKTEKIGNEDSRRLNVQVRKVNSTSKIIKEGKEEVKEKMIVSKTSKKLLEIKIRRNRRRKSLLSADFVISDMLLCDKTEEFQS